MEPLTELLNNKCVKKIDARTWIVAGILDGTFTIDGIIAASLELKENKVATILEAIEEITNKRIKDLDVDYLAFAKRYISSKDNACKRESSRIVGNLAARFPHDLEDCIPALIENTRDPGTVVRWGSAYALSRIILLEEYCHSSLFDRLAAIADQEQESGVKNQYMKALKKCSARRCGC